MKTLRERRYSCINCVKHSLLYLSHDLESSTNLINNTSNFFSICSNVEKKCMLFPMYSMNCYLIKIIVLFFIPINQKLLKKMNNK